MIAAACKESAPCYPGNAEPAAWINALQLEHSANGLGLDIALDGVVSTTAFEFRACWLGGIRLLPAKPRRAAFAASGGVYSRRQPTAGVTWSQAQRASSSSRTGRIGSSSSSRRPLWR